MKLVDHGKAGPSPSSCQLLLSLSHPVPAQGHTANCSRVKDVVWAITMIAVSPTWSDQEINSTGRLNLFFIEIGNLIRLIMLCLLLSRVQWIREASVWAIWIFLSKSSSFLSSDNLGAQLESQTCNILELHQNHRSGRNSGLSSGALAIHHYPNIARHKIYTRGAHGEMCHQDPHGFCAEQDPCVNTICAHM